MDAIIRVKHPVEEVVRVVARGLALANVHLDVKGALVLVLVLVPQHASVIVIELV